MTHDISWLVYGRSSDLRTWADDLDAKREAYKSAYTRNCDPKLVDTWFDETNHWFDATEAIRVGLATEIIEPGDPFKDPSLPKESDPENPDAEATKLGSELLCRLRGQFRNRNNFEADRPI